LKFIYRVYNIILNVGCMKVAWHGHACVSLESSNGYTIVFDPHDGGSIGLERPGVKADLVLVTHDHFDHNAVDVVKKNRTCVFKEFVGEAVVDNVRIEGFESFHDKAGGKRRGKNTIYLVEVEKRRVVHLGDLGDKPSSDVVSKLRGVDLLIIPVGGFYTIEPYEAWDIARSLNPLNILPIHYWVKGLNLPIKPVDEFLKLVEGFNIVKLDSNFFTLENYEKTVLIPRYR
jgi:L-ascorbate metabolism protein UlaG (beta-lactamase superfamily)